MPRKLTRVLLLLAVATVAGCTTIIARSPVPEGLIEEAKPYGIENIVARVWGDTIDEGVAERLMQGHIARMRTVKADEIAAGGPIVQRSLALSGGGPDGAFGAGMLKGWTARGDRPSFDLVTGISTGAIIAVFAFLGPEYDDALEEIYTTYTTDQLLTRTFFTALTGGSAITDNRRFRGLIEDYIDEDVLNKLAAAHEEGRSLLIGTTNIDAARPVVWNVTGIAASGHPDRGRLIHDIVQASSAIPAAFPPVLIPVVGADGKRYDEMHVDGGATQQVMFFSPQFPMRLIDEALGVTFERTIHVVVNNKLDKPYNPVRPRLLSIAGAAASSLIGGSGTGDIYKIFAIALRDGIDLKLMSIPRDFPLEPEEPFDKAYMKALFDIGYEAGLNGDQWQDRPPDYTPWPIPAESEFAEVEDAVVQ